MINYFITTLCYGSKYEQIKPKWEERNRMKCKNCDIKIYEAANIKLNTSFEYAWWDIIRLKNNLALSLETKKPVVQIDVDIIVEKDIESLVNLDYDFIISTEIGGNKSFPPECSKIVGFGVCSGFYIIKPTAFSFLSKILHSMNTKKYNSFSDQVNIMNYIINNKYTITNEEITLDNIKYINKIIHIDGIKICVLDFDIITRDPILNKGQFANHINVDNVGGAVNFLKYFDENLENLPLTCRCGKAHLGDTTVCKHLALRK
jgi:hypothetical protein